MSTAPTLLLIDIQKGLDQYEYYGGNRNNLHAEKNMGEILEHWRKKAWPLFHIKHNSTSADSPLRPGQNGNEIKQIVAPQSGEPIIGKNVNSAFIGTDLLQRLQALKVTQLVIIGLTTEHCVSTTTRMAGNFGFEVFLISDATAAFDRQLDDGNFIPAEDVHRVELALLDREFCKVITTKELFYEFV